MASQTNTASTAGRGAKIARRFTLIETLGGPGSWRAEDVDGSLWVIKIDRAAPPADAYLHPSLVPGETVAGHGARSWYPDVRSTGGDLATARRLAEALATLHARGAVHGNIKTSNVLLRERGTPLLVDPGGAGEPGADVAALAAVFSDWPLDGEDVREALGGAAAGMLTASALHDALDDIIVRRAAGAEARRGAATVQSRAEAETSEAGMGWLPRVAIGVTLAVAIGVLLYVTFGLSQPAVDVPGASEQAAPVEPEPEPVEPPTAEELETMLAARARAQAQLDEAIQLRLELQDQSVEEWASNEFEAAGQTLAQGDEAYRDQQFDRAHDFYVSGRDQLSDIATMGVEMAEAAIATGEAALEAGDAEVATAAFERAALIDAEDPRVTLGLTRATTLDQALALRNSGLQSEQAGRLEEALGLFRQLGELDPHMRGGAEGVARIEAAIADRDFRGAMSSGLAALRLGDLTEARAQLQRAAAMRPAHPAPREHLREVERLNREFEIDSHRVKAERALARGDWDQALAHFEACLRRDPNLAFAIEGRERAAYRRDLENSLESLLGNQGNWWSDEGRRRVRAKLTEAREVAANSPSPRLGERIDRLANALELANQPVQVTLQSDGACQVVVYKVARLGSFDQRQLELMPGHYTAVGTRDGFRDARLQFTVPAGGPPPDVVVTCQDSV